MQKFGVLLAKVCRRHAKRISSRWFVDETYLRVGKTWAYLYRAVDEEGQVVDVLLREKRDLESAEAFFEQAVERRGVVPDEVVTDKHRAYPRAGTGHQAGQALARSCQGPLEIDAQLEFYRNRAALARGRRVGSSGTA